MPLSDEDKQRIREEEVYRIEVRREVERESRRPPGQLPTPKRSGGGLFWSIAIILALVALVGAVAVMAPTWWQDVIPQKHKKPAADTRTSIDANLPSAVDSQTTTDQTRKSIPRSITQATADNMPTPSAPSATGRMGESDPQIVTASAAHMSTRRLPLDGVIIWARTIGALEAMGKDPLADGSHPQLKKSLFFSTDSRVKIEVVETRYNETIGADIVRARITDATEAGKTGWIQAKYLRTDPVPLQEVVPSSVTDGRDSLMQQRLTTVRRELHGNLDGKPDGLVLSWRFDETIFTLTIDLAHYQEHSIMASAIAARNIFESNTCRFREC